jgi:conjugative transfer region protein (TIGR03750 family)
MTAKSTTAQLEAPGAEERMAEGVRPRAAPVTDRVNVEPSILNGMTFTEAKVIALASFGASLVIGGIIFAATGLWHAPFLLCVFGPMGTLWFASLYLQTIKRGRPDAYYTQAIHLWLVERSLAKPKFIRHDGYWDLGRSLDFSLASPLVPPPDVSSTSFATHHERNPIS